MTTRPLFLAASVVLALAGCGAKDQPKPKPQLAVGVEPAAFADYTPRLTVLGTVQPLQSVAVRTRVDGQITAVLFREGDNVRAGQPLFRLDDRAVRAQIAESQAAIASAVATNAQATADFRRAQALIASGFISKATVEIKQAAAQTSAASIGSARAQLSAAQTALSYLTITAPVSGRSGEIAYKLGATVRAGDATPLVTINQLSPILVRFAVPPDQIQPLRTAMNVAPVTVAARVHDGATRLATGRLTFLDNNVDAGNGSLAAKAEFDNRDDALWPGALVDLEVPLGQPGRHIAVPEAAVQTGQDFTYVWTVGQGNVVAMTKVVLAGRADGRAFVEGGLPPGTKVVVDTLAKIKPGDKVRVKGQRPPVVAQAS